MFLHGSTRLSQSGHMFAGLHIQSELRFKLVQSGLWDLFSSILKLVSDPYGGHELLPHEYWASVDESLLPLNSRRVRFLFFGWCHDRCIPQQNSRSCFSSSVCVCVNHLNRCKTSTCRRCFSCFVFHDCRYCLKPRISSLFIQPAGGDRVAAWLSPTKLHAVD